MQRGEMAVDRNEEGRHTQNSPVLLASAELAVELALGLSVSLPCLEPTETNITS